MHLLEDEHVRRDLAHARREALEVVGVEGVAPAVDVERAPADKAAARRGSAQARVRSVDPFGV